MEIRFTMGDAGWVLKQLGYTHRHRPNDFIRNDSNGRFHAQIL
jgi:hypothetical protein